MEFCPKCGGMILVQNKKAKCTRCNYRPKKKPKIQVSEKLKEGEKVVVVKEAESATEPIVKIVCPKCKNEEAYFWTLQTRSSDESETKFYRCKKCKHTWRVYI